MTITLLLFGHAVAVAALAPRVLGGRRCAHRDRDFELLGLLGHHHPVHDVTVVPAPAPLVYCIPGTDQIVFTDTALAVLDGSELQAVLAHERAHLAGRHHLIVTWATALAEAFPGVPLFQGLRRASVDMVELLADNHAVRRESGDSLADALVALGTNPASAVGLSAGLAAAGGSVVVRVHRLLHPPVPLRMAT
jgi:hypothetical protein